MPWNRGSYLGSGEEAAPEQQPPPEVGSGHTRASPSEEQGHSSRSPRKDSHSQLGRREANLWPGARRSWGVGLEATSRGCPGPGCPSPVPFGLRSAARRLAPWLLLPGRASRVPALTRGPSAQWIRARPEWLQGRRGGARAPLPSLSVPQPGGSEGDRSRALLPPPPTHTVSSSLHSVPGSNALSLGKPWVAGDCLKVPSCPDAR